MKKTAIAFIVCMTSVSAFAQTVQADTAKKEFRNIIAINATSLLRQVLPGMTPLPSSSPNLISYRRIFKSNALRIGLGGNVVSDDQSLTDSTGTTHGNYNAGIRVGYEHYCYLAKKWMWYFGADLTVGHSVNNTTNYNAIATYKSSQTTNSYGISPFLGVTFNINPRLSIATEANLSIAYVQIKFKESSGPDPVYERHSGTNRILGQFSEPEFISVRLKF
ncbi:MAG: hypothetical protein JWO09_3519 [Bacteroidetes bacterium]|nr:hypothetical protein [Bacteroidota bacterium]